MASQAEIAFIQHLVVPTSLAALVRDDIPDDFLPTESLQAIFAFAKDYWFAEIGREQAPSPEAVATHFSTSLAEHEIDLNIDPEDTLEWSREVLTGAYVDRFWQMWMREAATQMADADVIAKPTVLADQIARVMTLQTRLTRRTEQDDVADGALDRALDRYYVRSERRAAGLIDGMVFGIEDLDNHTLGIKQGHVAVVAAPAKTGKSFLAAQVALANQRLGKTCTIFTLELSVNEMIDRLACLAMAVDLRAWLNGDCDEQEIARIRQWADAFRNGSHTGIKIVQPPPGQRTVQHLTRRAMAESEMFVVDQITFIEPNPEHARLPQWQQIGHSMHELKTLVTRGEGVACLLLHQINRDGIAAAKKTGKLEMSHLAAAAEIERTADWVFGLWQSEELAEVDRIWFQSLALRHAEHKHFELTWRPWVGQVECRGEIIPGDDD